VNSMRTLSSPSDAKRIIPISLLGISLALLTWPFSFQYWLHGDYDRFLWILLQPQPCASLGGMVVQANWTLSPFVVGVLGVIAIGFAGQLRHSLAVGLAIGVVLAVVVGGFMAVLPTTFARVIGC
jgi:hypothetical protein